MQTLPYSKIIAAIGGTGLTAAAVWLNAEHVAATESWNSPLVLAGVIVTLCAASAPPMAERAAKTAQPLKAAMIWVFFGLAVAFSLSASIARSSDMSLGRSRARRAAIKPRSSQKRPTLPPRSRWRPNVPSAGTSVASWKRRLMRPGRLS